MHDLKITLVQAPLVWENKVENLRFLSEKIDTVTAPTDVIVLPEMFSTGFSMNSKVLAEKMDGLAVAWMREQAAKKNCVVVGSLILEENSKFFNRLIQYCNPTVNIGACTPIYKRMAAVEN